MPPAQENKNLKKIQENPNPRSGHPAATVARSGRERRRRRSGGGSRAGSGCGKGAPLLAASSGVGRRREGRAAAARPASPPPRHRRSRPFCRLGGAEKGRRSAAAAAPLPLTSSSHRRSASVCKPRASVGRRGRRSNGSGGTAPGCRLLIVVVDSGPRLPAAASPRSALHEARHSSTLLSPATAVSLPPRADGRRRRRR